MRKSVMRNNAITISFSSLFLFFLSNQSFAQKNFNHHYYEEYAQVLSIAQDSTGFLWIRATSRLGKFDGYEIQTYTDSLGNNIVGQLTTNATGRLFVIDEDGNRIHRFSTNKDSFDSLEPDLNGTSISVLGFDADSRLWIGTRQGSLFLYDPRSNSCKQFINDDFGSQPRSNLIHDIQDQGTNLLLGTSLGLWQFNKQLHKFSRPKNLIDPILISEPIRKIFFQKDGYWFYLPRVLIKTDLQFHVIQSFHFPDEFDPVQVARDDSGLFWMISPAQGMISYNPNLEKVESYRANVANKQTLSADILNCVLIDREQNVWTGTYDRGFDQLKKQALSLYNYYLPDEVPVGHPQILNTQKGNFILSESKIHGLYFSSLYDDPAAIKFEPIRTKPNLAGIHTNSALLTNDAWWIGTFGKGLVKVSINHQAEIPFGPIEFIQVKKTIENSIGSNDAGIWAADTHGNLWISAPQNSLQLISGDIPYGQRGSVITFTHDPDDSTTISSGYIWGVLAEDDGSAWVLTDFNLDFYNDKNGSFRKIFSRPAGTTYNFTLAKSTNGFLFIGGSDGLTILKAQENGGYNIENPKGLKGRVIYAIEEDSLGRWWCYGDNGLFCFDPKDETVIQFTEDDGLASNEGTANSSTYTSNGLMIFGNQAFTVFDPLSFHANTTEVKPVITRLKLNNNIASLSQKSAVSLNHTHRVLTLEFAALQFSNPKKNLYRYKLEGFDPEWIEIDYKNRQATYTNLPPGNYTFLIKASNDHGIWSDLETALAITVQPPPWRTWWAYTGYALLVAGMLVWARRNIVQRERLKSNLQLAQVEQEKEHFELEKAKEVDRVKTSFFTNISHEFRTPLTLIKGPVEEMLDQFKDDPKVQARLKMVQRNSDLLLKLINQLLDLAKLESGSLKVEKTEGDLFSFIRAIANSFESLARQKNVSLNVVVPPESYSARFDKDKLETILINLINNAIKFTKEGDVTVEVSIESSALMLTMKDTGIGIPEDQQSKIFERFHQVSEAHKEVGTGIGLALVKELVVLLGGSIEVQSKVGEGSIFSVILPIEVLQDTGYELQAFESVKTEIEPKGHVASELESRQTTSSGQTTTPQPKQDPIGADTLTKPHILVVEDNSDLRAFIIDSLGSEFYFLEAENGKQGLEKASEEIPDLIISDVMMPEMDGITMAGKVKADVRTSHIPLILLTAKSTDESKLSGLQSGADDYLTKPFNKTELLLKVRNSIAVRARLREKIRAELMSTAPRQEVLSADEQFLQKVKEAILHQLSDEQLSVESLADDIGLSRVQLYRKISALTGISVNELIRKLRLQKAAQLLEAKWGPVSQVAYEVGFSNLSYFSKVFKEEFNVLPSEYEKQ